jgi:RNA polymerase sigma-70 factor, ECF subfamily
VWLGSGDEHDMRDATVLHGDQPDLRAELTSFYNVALHEVYRYFHRGTAGDRRVTEDLTQETFMACVDAAGRGNRNALTMPWLMTVARNKLVDHYRRTNREVRKLSLVWSARHDEEEPEPFRLSDAAALQALCRLAPLHRLVLVLRYVDDLPVHEIAIAIKRSVRATESLLVRARQALEEIVRSDSDV